MAFEAVFSTLVMRVAFGRDFSTDPADDDDALTAMVTTYLFGAGATRSK
jgi:hypothetical protein